MKKYCFILVLILSYQQSKGQEFYLDFNYHYLYDRKFDQYIQTYNFSRPFLEKQQPLFQNGGNLKAGFLTSKFPTLNHGIFISNSVFISSARNPNFLNTLVCDLLAIGYKLRLDNLTKSQKLFINAEIGYLHNFLFRRLNGENHIYEIDYGLYVPGDPESGEDDVTYSKASGSGMLFNLDLGYKFELDEHFSISPKIGVSYVPFLINRNAERVINQTIGLVEVKGSMQLWILAGVSFGYRK